MLQMTHPNVVQSIRAFQPEALRQEADKLTHHFLYANLSQSRSRTQVFRTISASFHLPWQYSKNHENLRHCMTRIMHNSGTQTGFLVVLEHIPSALKFGAEARERLLDVFRDITDYWAEHGVPFRVFYSYSVANMDTWEAMCEMQQQKRLKLNAATYEEAYKPGRRGRKPKVQPADSLPSMRSVFDTQGLEGAI